MKVFQDGCVRVSQQSSFLPTVAPACSPSAGVCLYLLWVCNVCHVLATRRDLLMENRWASPCLPSENKPMIIRCSILAINQHNPAPPSLHPNNSPTAAHSLLCPSEHLVPWWPFSIHFILFPPPLPSECVMPFKLNRRNIYSLTR